MKWLLAALLMLWSSAVTAAAPIKVMILDGASAAAYHDWTAHQPRSLKRETGRDRPVRRDGGERAAGGG